MTTIAYRDGIMACDSAWTCGGTVDTLTTKMERLQSGAILGMAGQNDGRALSAMLDKVKTPAGLPSYDDIMNLRASLMGLLVLPKGKIYKIETTVVSPENWSEDSPDGTFGIWEITGPFAAVGSGGDLRAGGNGVRQVSIRRRSHRLQVRHQFARTCSQDELEAVSTIERKAVVASVIFSEGRTFLSLGSGDHVCHRWEISERQAKNILVDLAGNILTSRMCETPDR